MKEEKSNGKGTDRAHDSPVPVASGPGEADGFGAADPALRKPDSGNPSAEAICDWLKKVRFRKTLLGGVDEADVWKKLAELQKLYETALTAERLRYDALLADARQPQTGGQKENSGDPGNQSGAREIAGEAAR